MFPLRDLARIYALVAGVCLVVLPLLLILVVASEAADIVGVVLCGSIIPITLGALILWYILSRQEGLPTPTYYAPPQQYYAYRYHQGYYPYLAPSPAAPQTPTAAPPVLGPVIGLRGRTLQERLDIPGAGFLLGGFIASVLIGFAALLLGGVLVLLFVPAFIIAFSFPSLMWISWVYSRDTYSPEPARLVLKALTWGMLSTVPALYLEFGVGFALPGLGVLMVTGAAPIIEEFVKPLILPSLRKQLNSDLDGIIYGVSAGMGFAMVENLFFEVSALFTFGTVGWAITAPLRGLGGIGVHALGPALIGLTYARYVRTGRGFEYVVGAFLAGVMVHGLWNGSASLLDSKPAVALLAMLLMPIAIVLVVRWLIEGAAGEERTALIGRGMLTPTGEVTIAGFEAGFAGPLSVEAEGHKQRQEQTVVAAQQQHQAILAAQMSARQPYWGPPPPAYHAQPWPAPGTYQAPGWQWHPPPAPYYGNPYAQPWGTVPWGYGPPRRVAAAPLAYPPQSPDPAAQPTPEGTLQGQPSHQPSPPAGPGPVGPYRAALDRRKPPPEDPETIPDGR